MIPARRPRCEFLSQVFIHKIVDEALALLEKHGVFVENPEALRLFEDAGMAVDKSSRRVRITPRLVEDCLAATPPHFTLFDRSGEKACHVGGDVIHFNPGSAAVTILDPKMQAKRKPITRDLINFARLTDSLPHIHFQSTALISADVPEDVADAYRLLVGLQYCSKPVVTGTFRVEGFGFMRDMLAAVRGSSNALAEKPLAVFDACPSPPLKWSHLTSQSVMDCARAGIPSTFISMGMTGATSPVTIAGTLVQHVAENLAGLAIAQLASKGAPVVFGGSPSSFDMRKGTTPMGAIETMMIDSAYAQIGKHLGLPTHAYMALSDAKVVDAQSGLETGMGAMLAALSGINIISGPGMLDFESCQSLEKLVIDHEICEMVDRLVEGIAGREEPLALGLFESLNESSQFLSHPHTRMWYRKEHILPTLVERDTYDSWVAQGKKTMADRAADDVGKRLNETPENRLPDELVRELKSIMLAYGRKYGLDSLPNP